MPQFLVYEDGRFRIRNGQFVLSDDPGNCSCCKPTHRLINADLEDTPPPVYRPLINADLTDTAPQVQRPLINAELHDTPPPVEHFTIRVDTQADVSHTITSD